MTSAGSGPLRARLGWAYRLVWLAVAVAASIESLRAVWAFTIDDAGISYAYAKHLADGQGPVAVVGGPWVEGYSNPLWVFLLVPLHALGFALPVAAKWLGATLFALALGAGSAFISLVGGRRWWAFGATEMSFVIVSALCLELVVWVPAGLENALFAALLLGVVFLDARESQSPSAFATSGLAAFALAITRPEGALYAAPLVLIKLGRAFARREPLRQALTATMLFVAPFVLYHAGHYLAFGQLVPNTYWAKPAGKTWTQGLRYLDTTLRESGLVYALPLALLGLYGKPRAKLLVGWAALAGVLFVVYSGGDWMPNGRFLSLFAPALLVLAAVGLEHVARAIGSLSRGRLPREAAACALAGVLGFSWLDYQQPRLAALQKRGWCHFCERVADTARVRRLGQGAGLPSQSLVTHDFGGPSWLSADGFYPVDFLGLCDRSAALLRHRRAPGSVGYDLRLYQYFIHEQPTAPSWVLVPPNFWPLFDRSPEAVLDYYPLSARLLPRTRRDSFFVLHRGELVDYFPPVPAADLHLPEQLALVGFAPFAEAAAKDVTLGPGVRVRFVVSVVPRGELSGGERIGIRVAAAGEHADSELVPIDRGLAGLAKALTPGEPLAFELSVTLPRAAVEGYELSLGVAPAARNARRQGLTAPAFTPLATLPAGTALPALERSLPRYPSALPAPRDPELIRRRSAVTAVVDQARRSGQSPSDARLSRELIGLAGRLEARGEVADAYLASVWATQVRRRAWEELADSVFRLRPRTLDDEHALEITLLRRYYRTARVDELGHLIAFYLSLGRELEADYFLGRWPASERDSELGRALRAARGRELHVEASAERQATSRVLELVALDPLGGALDFETPVLSGWDGPAGAFRVELREDRQVVLGLRGQHGAGVLSSREGGERSRGALTSSEFRLDGRQLSLLVAGGSRSRQVGVELLVDGVVAFSASGNDSDNLLPVFWDIAPFAGKSGRLRVFDESPRAHVVLDRVLIWR
jgi:hypothetical protein